MFAGPNGDGSRCEGSAGAAPPPLLFSQALGLLGGCACWPPAGAQVMSQHLLPLIQTRNDPGDADISPSIARERSRILRTNVPSKAVPGAAALQR